MSKFTVKVYVVQRLGGEVVAVKLTFLEAHDLAVKFAPASVTMYLADKSPEPNGAAYVESQRKRN